MSLTAALIGLFGDFASIGSAMNDVRTYLTDRLDAETILANLIERRFHEMLPRLQHHCSGGEPVFNKAEFIDILRSKDLQLSQTDDLVSAVVPVLAGCVFLPGKKASADALGPVYDAIVRAAVQRMWNRVAAHPALADAILIDQGKTLEQRLGDSHKHLDDGLSALGDRLDEVLKGLREFKAFSLEIPRQIHSALLDRDPPAEHQIDNQIYRNPFLLVRAEDFNHNYEKLARLFQHAPEWTNVQSRTENAFVEGGRGTGKSMILRRLTVQAAVAAARLSNSRATFTDVADDYLGVYVKLSRGYYDQFEGESGPKRAAELLAQQELNIEIFDAFVDAMKWLEKENAMPALSGRWTDLARRLSTLFPGAPVVTTLEELQTTILRAEQEAIQDYCRDVAFERPTNYRGSARDTVGFMRQLSALFRTHIAPARDMRLFVLFDEFETLTPLQQKALNTVMKMRLPDLTLKIGVRKEGIKTLDTFTPGDPIQQPRDYTIVRLDYDVRSREYAKLLTGIAEMRLREAGYDRTSIADYLGTYDSAEEASPQEIESELTMMWNSGTRRTNLAMNTEFRGKYTWTAIYRIRSRKNRRKLFFGFEHFALLSSGITSSFIELCKYAFYFALEEGLPLNDTQRIPTAIQTDAVYAVSQRLLEAIDGNVPDVGGILQRLVQDLGGILRVRLMNHTSDPEANRIALTDAAELEDPRYAELATVIHGGVTWSVLDVVDPSSSFRPRTLQQLRSSDIIINRIYCPALNISPRSRWRTPMKTADLAALIDPAKRGDAFRRMTRALAAQSPDADDDQATFLGEEST